MPVCHHWHIFSRLMFLNELAVLFDLADQTLAVYVILAIQDIGHWNMSRPVVPSCSFYLFFPDIFNGQTSKLSSYTIVKPQLIHRRWARNADRLPESGKVRYIYRSPNSWFEQTMVNDDWCIFMWLCCCCNSFQTEEPDERSYSLIIDNKEHFLHLKKNT